MRLLIVDDSRLDRTKIKRLVNQMNADVSLAEAADVPTALGMVAVEKFDCILLDYRLPGSDGMELASAIAASRGGSGTPIVMLTGDPSEDLAEQAIDAGLTDFLGKRNLSAEHLRQTLFNAQVKHRKATAAGISHTSDSGVPTGRGPSLSDDERLAIANALDILERAGIFDHAHEGDDEVYQALQKLRDTAASVLVH